MRIILFLMITVTCLDLFAQEEIVLYKESSILNVVQRTQNQSLRSRRTSKNQSTHYYRRGSRYHARVVFLNKREKNIEINNLSKIKESEAALALEELGVFVEYLRSTDNLIKELEMTMDNIEVRENNLSYSLFEQGYTSCGKGKLVLRTKKYHNLAKKIEYTLVFIMP